MSWVLPDPKVDDKPWDDERPGVQRNFDAIRNAFPLSPSADNFQQVPQARVYRSTSQSIANATNTAISMDGEDYDLGTATEQHTSGAASKLTCQAPGLYSVAGNATFDGASSAGIRVLYLLLNSDRVLAFDHKMPLTGGNFTSMNLAAHFRLVVGDFVELVAGQSSGGALNIIQDQGSADNASTVLQWHWVSP